MTSIIELAYLSDAAYQLSGNVVVRDPKNQERVWERAASNTLSGGFSYAIFKRRGANESVLAYRGTDTTLSGFVQDLDDDVAIMQNNPPAQLRLAIDVASSVGGPCRFLTGHSLGGALAALVAGMRRRRAVTFDAPGVLTECVRASVRTLSFSALKGCVFGADVTNIRMAGDPVSSWWTTGFQVGERRRTVSAPDGTPWFAPLQRHSLKTLLESLAAQPSNWEPIS